MDVVGVIKYQRDAVATCLSLSPLSRGQVHARLMGRVDTSPRLPRMASSEHSKHVAHDCNGDQMMVRMTIAINYKEPFDEQGG